MRRRGVSSREGIHRRVDSSFIVATAVRPLPTKPCVLLCRGQCPFFPPLAVPETDASELFQVGEALVLLLPRFFRGQRTIQVFPFRRQPLAEGLVAQVLNPTDRVFVLIEGRGAEVRMVSSIVANRSQHPVLFESNGVVILSQTRKKERRNKESFRYFSFHRTLRLQKPTMNGDARHPWVKK